LIVVKVRELRDGPYPLVLHEPTIGNMAVEHPEIARHQVHLMTLYPSENCKRLHALEH